MMERRPEFSQPISAAACLAVAVLSPTLAVSPSGTTTIATLAYKDEATPPSALSLIHGGPQAAKFRALAEEWYRDRPRGTLEDMCAHRAYLRVIAMGPPAIPLILQELQRRPEHWFTALSILTDAKGIVPPASRGRLKEMADAWIRWGIEAGYLQR